MKVLVLGGSGMAGHMVKQYLIEAGHEVEAPTHEELDLSNEDHEGWTILDKGFDFVINCVGVLNTRADEDVARTIKLNSLLPHLLENIYADSETRVIHLSTDCVFSGFTGPYLVDSSPDGPLLYDKSKALGELWNDKDITLRTSIIGPELKDGTGLFHWFMKQKGDVQGYTEVIWSGITTLELAKRIGAIIDSSDKVKGGVYHPTPHAAISKASLLMSIQSIFHKQDVTIVPDRIPQSNKRLVPTPPYAAPDYNVMLSELYDWMVAHPKLYKERYGL